MVRRELSGLHAKGRPLHKRRALLLRYGREKLTLIGRRNFGIGYGRALHALFWLHRRKIVRVRIAKGRSGGVWCIAARRLSEKRRTGLRDGAAALLRSFLGTEVVIVTRRVPSRLRRKRILPPGRLLVWKTNGDQPS